jgi:hypothetical protein
VLVRLIIYRLVYDPIARKFTHISQQKQFNELEMSLREKNFLRISNMPMNILFIGFSLSIVLTKHTPSVKLWEFKEKKLFLSNKGEIFILCGSIERKFL